MECNKINNEVPRFITKKWIEVQSQPGNTYNTCKPIRFKTSMLRSDLCDYSDPNFDKRLTIKNNAPFISCISKINGELVENA